MAPTCCLEQLVYDCRLMNEALADGPEAALTYRNWMTRSDAARDPQAFILTPENTLTLARTIVNASNPYEAGRAAALAALGLIRDAHKEGALRLPPRETPYLDRLQKTLEAMPSEESRFIEEMLEEVDRSKFSPREYGIDA